MKYQKPYIIQYVGFQTGLDEDTFLQSWSPFASSIKSAGIEKIDIYTVQKKEVLTYISRNVWPAEAFLKNFPTGVPGAARTQDVVVLQFGGYWLREEEIDRPDDMLLLFQRTPFALEEKEDISRSRVTESVPFQQMLVLSDPKQEYSSTNKQFAFYCSHLKSL
ncbi:hypothetical protein OKW21_003834 [Catalinimonas alkaloidigena]|uniref:hypothetical protein n=1 Tax=Catalinimonas alkaloidigena TaxID=1075417 RepID=UPI0024057564|nr:hypothetical protein [Catalinimonas alkaloidigena]MDF9798571.1 hypothetical protein [Catalinimonas alkaloidigena]